MVVDEIGNASLCYALGPGIEVALRYLASTDLMALDPGRYELDGGCFAIVQDYETIVHGKKRWEAHRKYIDVQFIASGIELMGYAYLTSTEHPEPVEGHPEPVEGRSVLCSVEAYDEAKDIEWFEGEGSFVEARAGTFVILYPHDAHMPGVMPLDGPATVRKVVVKVPAERQM